MWLVRHNRGARRRGWFVTGSAGGSNAPRMQWTTPGAPSRSHASRPVPGVRFAKRAAIGAGYVVKPVGRLLTWLFTSREVSNFTYDLDPLNCRYLACFASAVTHVPPSEINGYLEELSGDAALRAHIRDGVATGPAPWVGDRDVRFGRRAGWYAVVRAVKPRLVVETGVDKGLGACVLTAALSRNAQAGFPGRYVGTDIEPAAGYLLTGHYASFGEIRFGDSVESLRRMDGPIDVFINDSDHSAEYEAREYATIADKVTDDAILLGDNCHVTGALLDFAERTGRSFLFFQERPLNHWYPGGGIGGAFRAERHRTPVP